MLLVGWSIYILSFWRIVQLHAQFAWRMDVRGCLPGAGSWSWKCCRHFTSAKPAIGGSLLAKRARGASCNFEEGQNFYDSPQLQLACHSWARKWRKWRRQLKSLKLKPLHHQLRRNHPCRAPNAATSSNSFFLLRKRLYWSFVRVVLILDPPGVLDSSKRALKKTYRFNVGTAAGAFHQPAKREQLSVLPAAHRLAHLFLEIYSKFGSMGIWYEWCAGCSGLIIAHHDSGSQSLSQKRHEQILGNCGDILSWHGFAIFLS